MLSMLRCVLRFLFLLVTSAGAIAVEVDAKLEHAGFPLMFVGADAAATNGASELSSCSGASAALSPVASS